MDSSAFSNVIDANFSDHALTNNILPPTDGILFADRVPLSYFQTLPTMKQEC